MNLIYYYELHNFLLVLYSLISVATTLPIRSLQKLPTDWSSESKWRTNFFSLNRTSELATKAFALSENEKHLERETLGKSEFCCLFRGLFSKPVRFMNEKCSLSEYITTLNQRSWRIQSIPVNKSYERYKRKSFGMVENLLWCNFFFFSE